MSTPGINPAASLAALKLAFLWFEFLALKMSRFLTCLLRLCTTLTPDIFSLKAAFTIAIRILTSMKAFFAYFCQTIINITNNGSTISVRRASL